MSAPYAALGGHTSHMHYLLWREASLRLESRSMKTRTASQTPSISRSVESTVSTPGAATMELGDLRIGAITALTCARTGMALSGIPVGSSGSDD